MRSLVLALLIVVIVGCAETPERSDAGPPRTTEETTTEAAKTARTSKLRTVTIHTSSGREVRVRVEIADDYFEITRGLMYRTALAENQGMLFVYAEEQELSLWMKNTLIPLSAAFMDAEGRIVDIQDMKPLDDEPPSYVSAEPAQYALEVNQGFFEERGVEVGDRAEWPRITLR